MMLQPSPVLPLFKCTIPKDIPASMIVMKYGLIHCLKIEKISLETFQGGQKNCFVNSLFPSETHMLSMLRLTNG
jgi:hypothetical protein